MAVSFQRGCHKVNRILEPRSQFPHSPSKSDLDRTLRCTQMNNPKIVSQAVMLDVTLHEHIKHHLQQPATVHATGRSWPSEDSVKRGSWPSEEQKKSPWPSEAPLGKGFWFLAKALVFFPLPMRFRTWFLVVFYWWPLLYALSKFMMVMRCNFWKSSGGHFEFRKNEGVVALFVWF